MKPKMTKEKIIKEVLEEFLEEEEKLISKLITRTRPYEIIFEKAVEKALQKQEEEFKRRHPKGFCLICGNRKSITIHHLKEIKQYLKKGKTKINFKGNNGEVPLCRSCHDCLEQIKSGMLNYKRAKKQTKEEILKIIDDFDWFEPVDKDWEIKLEELKQKIKK